MRWQNPLQMPSDVHAGHEGVWDRYSGFHCTWRGMGVCRAAPRCVLQASILSQPRLQYCIWETAAHQSPCSRLSYAVQHDVYHYSKEVVVPFVKGVLKLWGLQHVTHLQDVHEVMMSLGARATHLTLSGRLEHSSHAAKLFACCGFLCVDPA